MSTLHAPHPVYGGYPSNSELSLSTFDDSSKLKDGQQLGYGREISRTPSPTQEEFNLLHGIKAERTTQEKIKLYAIIAIVIGIAVLISVETKNIVHGLKPATDWLRDHSIGPLIPIAIIVVLSFPPLFGQELVATLVGVTWDLPEAFAIVAAGTVIGEVANFFTFKYACSARGAKLELKSVDYGLLASIVRNGGFWVILVIRYSAVPPHFATTVFSTVGISFWVFLAAAILSLPKQLVPVYIGHVMQPSVEDDGTSKIVENVVLVAGIVVTIVAYLWIKKQLKAAIPDYVYKRRKARQVGGSTPPHYAEINLPAV